MSEKKENRGGARPGAGRKSQGYEMVTITLRLPEHLAGKLRAISKDQGRPIWRVIEGLIDG